MKLQKQPNNYTCMITAFAMCYNIPVIDLINIVGHDGSKIAWPELESPQCYVGHHEQELVDAGYTLGYYVIRIIGMPASAHDDCEPHLIYSETKCASRLKKYMTDYIGVITSDTHAVAWDGKRFYNPNGSIKDKFDYPIREFFLLLI